MVLYSVFWMSHVTNVNCSWLRMKLLLQISIFIAVFLSETFLFQSTYLPTTIFPNKIQKIQWWLRTLRCMWTAEPWPKGLALLFCAIGLWRSCFVSPMYKKNMLSSTPPTAQPSPHLSTGACLHLLIITSNAVDAFCRVFVIQFYLSLTWNW